jgi:hypothetical protein
MGWIWYSGKICLFSGADGDMFLQDINMAIGDQYVIVFTITGMTQGILEVTGFEETNEFTEDGTYTIVGTAVNDKLIFLGKTDEDENLFDGCVDSIQAYTFASQVSTACSPCINVREDQDDCLLLITAENDNNALNFNWTGLTLKARIDAKFARVSYNTQKEDFDDNSGDRITTYFDGKKNRDLLVQANPIFIHDFLYMCMGVDTFKINGVEYVLVDDNYPNIEWNKQFKEGAVELRVRKKNSKLNKTNCG